MAPKGHLLQLRRPSDPWRFPEGPVHHVAVIEAGEGIFELSCRCGAQSYTVWGLEHAKMMARGHYVRSGTPIPKNAY